MTALVSTHSKIIQVTNWSSMDFTTDFGDWIRLQGSDGSKFTIQRIRFDAKHSFQSVWRQKQTPSAYTFVVAFAVDIEDIEAVRVYTAQLQMSNPPSTADSRIGANVKSCDRFRTHKVEISFWFGTFGKLHAAIFQFAHISSCVRHHLIRHEESLEKLSSICASNVNQPVNGIRMIKLSSAKQQSMVMGLLYADLSGKNVDATFSCPSPKTASNGAVLRSHYGRPGLQFRSNLFGISQVPVKVR